MYQQWLDTLSTCSLFDQISQEEMLSILHCMNLKVSVYKKNDYLKAEGEDFSQIGIVLEGNVALTKENAAGSRVIIGILGPGEMFGEMAAYSGKRFWPVSVIAHTHCTVLFFSQDKIIGCCEKVCTSHKQLILNMLKVVSNRALMLNRKLEYLAMKSLRSKICTYLLEEFKKSGSTATFQLHLNRNELADFLNVSRPSLSRELCKMRDEGLIDFHSTAVKIRNLETLKEMSE